VNYHLWLIPCSKDQERIGKLVDELSARFQAPHITPHLSLLIRIPKNEADLVSKTKKLAQAIEPICLRSLKVGWMEDFHRCLFLRTEKNAALTRARQKASSLFQASENREFIPHVSILYGNIPTKTKKQIANEIQKQVPKQVVLDQLWLVCDTDQKNYWKPVVINCLGEKN